MKLKTKRIMKSFLPVLVLAVLVVPVFVGAAGPFAPPNVNSTKTFTEILRSILMYLMMFIGIAAVIGFVVAGIMYITAAGDEDRVKSAKNMLLYSIIGVVVALIGWAAIGLIFSLFTTTNPTGDL